jgi:hypothetical protein
LRPNAKSDNLDRRAVQVCPSALNRDIAFIDERCRHYAQPRPAAAHQGKRDRANWASVGVVRGPVDRVEHPECLGHQVRSSLLLTEERDLRSLPLEVGADEPLDFDIHHGGEAVVALVDERLDMGTAPNHRLAGDVDGSLGGEKEP